MHQALELLGPLPLAMLVVGLAMGIGAVFMIWGVFRRPRAHFGPLGGWPYAAIGVVYLAVAVLGPTGLIPATPVTGLIVIAIFIVAFFVEVAYALRVVFPTPPERLAARGGALSSATHAAEMGTEAGGAAGDVGETDIESPSL